MEYKIIRTEQSEEPIEHALFGKKGGAQKGSTWDNHKYIARQKMANGWRYFYSQAELAAAKAKQTGQKAASAVGDAAKKGVANVKRSAADLKGYARKVDSDRNRYKEAIDKANGQGTNALRRAVNAENARNSDNANAYISTKSYVNNVNAKNNTKWYEFGKRAKLTEAAENSLNNYRYFHDSSDKNQARLNNAEAAKDRYFKERDALRSDRDAYNKNVNEVKYGLSIALNKADKAIDKGKSAISKLIGSTKDTAAKAITTASDEVKSLAVKGKNAASKLLSDAKEGIKSIRSTDKKSDDDAVEIQPKNNRQYNGTSQKAEGDETRATKDMYKNSSDEYIEALYFNSRKNDGSGVSKYLENEYNYRKVAQEANYLGRLTDSLSDDAEAALKKYGKNSDTYKRAYEKMEEAFDKLHDAEAELAKLEKNR